MNRGGCFFWYDLFTEFWLKYLLMIGMPSSDCKGKPSYGEEGFCSWLDQYEKSLVPNAMAANTSENFSEN